MSLSRGVLIVTGHVLGVYFAILIKSIASRYDLTGYLTGLWNGKARIIFEGEKENIDKAVSEIYNISGTARVDKVSVNWEYDRKGYDDFDVK